MNNRLKLLPIISHPVKRDSKSRSLFL